MMSATDAIPVRLPSGLQVMLSPLRMADENKLSQAGRTQFDQVLEGVVSAHIGAVVDPGPYPQFEAGGPVNWDALLSGDAFVVMLELRKISYDDGNTFTVLDLQCPSGSCPKFDYDIDLEADIIRRDIDEVGAHALRSGEPLLCQVDGRVVAFDLASGASVRRVRVLDTQYPGRKMAARLRSRIREVQGLGNHEIMDWLDGANGTSKLHPGLRVADSERLRDAMDEHECGIDTEVEITCAQCGRTYMIDLPFDAGFLAPGIGIARRKRARRRGNTSSAS